MRKQWPYLAFMAALVATSVFDALLIFRVPLWIIGAAMFVRSTMRAKGFDRWWPVACVAVFAAAVATLELATGLSLWARRGIILFGGAALLATLVVPLFQLVKILIEAHALVRKVRIALKDPATFREHFPPRP